MNYSTTYQRFYNRNNPKNSGNKKRRSSGIQVNMQIPEDITEVQISGKMKIGIH